jgi:predicted PurR-regulated permease PerM
MKPADPRPDPDVSERFARRVLLAALIVALVLGGLLLLWYAVWVLLVIFGGILMAVLLSAIAEGVAWLTRLSRGWSLVIVVLGLVVIFGTIGWLAAPSVSHQVDQLTDKLPASVQKLKGYLDRSAWGHQIVSRLWTPRGMGDNSQLVEKATGIASVAVTVIVTIVVVFAVGLYLAGEPEMYLSGFTSLFPHPMRPRIHETLQTIGLTLKWWILGQCVTMVVIGSLTMFGLWLIGIPLWFLIGLLAALFNFIPNFGPLVSFIPAVLLALTIDPAKVLWVCVLWVVAQSLEGYVVTPLVQREMVWLPPALTIVVQVLMGVLVGPIGVVFAAPLTAATLVAVKMLYVEDVMGDPPKLPVTEEE